LSKFNLSTSATVSISATLELWFDCPSVPSTSGCHEVVHNKFVVDRLKTKGAIFVEEIDEVPTGKVVIFSAKIHGNIIAINFINTAYIGIAGGCFKFNAIIKLDA
jgi:hypothetical protein